MRTDALETSRVLEGVHRVDVQVYIKVDRGNNMPGEKFPLKT